MKVFLRDSSLSGLRRSLQKHGDSLVASEDSAEIVLTNDETLPEVVRQELFGATEASVARWPDYWITRFAFEGQLREQVAVGIPVLGTCNENLGADEVGCVGVRFLPAGSLSELFQNGLHMILQEMKYTGFVSLHFRTGVDLPVAIQLGVPCGGLYALMESLRGSICEFWLSPWRLFESWCVALPIIRGCYPMKVVEKCIIGGLDPSVADHCHLFVDSLFIEKGQQFAGIVSSSHGSLHIACHKVLELARSLVIPEKQFRTDIEWELSQRWFKLRPLVIKPSASPLQSTSSVAQEEQSS